MSNLTDGGPAFPQISELGDIAATSGGMSLRDYIAVNALNALISKAPFFDSEGEHGKAIDMVQFKEDMSVSAYCYADAMLEARKE